MIKILITIVSITLMLTSCSEHKDLNIITIDGRLVHVDNCPYSSVASEGDTAVIQRVIGTPLLARVDVYSMYKGSMPDNNMDVTRVVGARTYVVDYTYELGVVVGERR